MNRIYFFLLAFLLTIPVFAKNKTSKTEVKERVINVDFINEKGPLNTMFKDCVGAGRANEGLRAEWQKQSG